MCIVFIVNVKLEESQMIVFLKVQNKMMSVPELLCAGPQQGLRQWLPKTLVTFAM